MIVHKDNDREYTSNGLMYWFHDEGGRSFAHQIIHHRWVHRPDTEIFDANYGAKPPEFGFTFEREDVEVDVTQDQGWIESNQFSTFTLAEALKRLVVYRENPETWFEYSTWEDIKVLLYGAQSSLSYEQKYLKVWRTMSRSTCNRLLILIRLKKTRRVNGTSSLSWA